MSYGYGYYQYLNIEFWENRILRFTDAFPALCYAYGIESRQLPQWMLQETTLKHQGWSIEKQIDIVHSLKTRRPISVFEIGAGRGELINTFSYLESDVDSCEVNEEIYEWYHKTGQHFFGYKFRPRMPLIGEIQNLNVDWKNYDTIVMVECIEHIREEAFNQVWDNIVRNFRGRFIVTNYIGMHPIEIGGDWEDAANEHCRRIDENVYDELAQAAKAVVYRKGSHLVLDF